MMIWEIIFTYPIVKLFYSASNYYKEATTQIPTNWILAGALIVLLIGLIFDQIKRIFKKKKKKK